MIDEKEAVGAVESAAVEQRRRRFAALLLCAGVVALLEVAFTVEWSSPPCGQDAGDGPVAAVFGMPFPYVRWTTGLSWVYVMMPHVYVINLVVLALLVWPVARLAVARRMSPRVATSIGLALLILGGTGRVFLLLGLEEWWPVVSIARSDEQYWQFRPVGVASYRHYNCKPSEFWFGEVKDVGMVGAPRNGTALQR